ncbi:MAG TPA: hypothetical protein VG778_05830, partial [Blastocatellia bacterium]|nr:hypothetical protein [Blastocatellia bacterium]
MSKKLTISILSALLVWMTPLLGLSSASNNQELHNHEDGHSAVSKLGVSAHYLEEGRVVCRQATVEEAAAVLERDPDFPLQVISDNDSGHIKPQAGGFTIILRGTSRFEAATQAKQAVLRAASKWQSIIQNPVTIYIDVDYGP